jgi:predicted dinucleotide-binding enzyme
MASVAGLHHTGRGEVGELFEDAGFFVIDLGGLREGGRMQEVRAPLAGHDLIRLS